MSYSGNYISDTDIDNWPSGTTDADKEALIKYVEQLIEKILGRPFYSKSFDIEINGNDESRIFPPLHANILTVTSVRVNGLVMDDSWYACDENSVYIDLTVSGAGIGDPELVYNLTRVEEIGLFPRGYNNIRIQGTYGSTTVRSRSRNSVLSWPAMKTTTACIRRLAKYPKKLEIIPIQSVPGFIRI